MKKKNRSEEINYLELTPIRNFEFEVREDGRAAIKMPKFTNKVLVSLISKRLKKQTYNLVLDEIGSEVWKELNGNKNVQQIVSSIEDKMGEKVAPATERITKFLTELYNNDIIAFKEISRKE